MPGERRSSHDRAAAPGKGRGRELSGRGEKGSRNRQSGPGSITYSAATE